MKRYYLVLGMGLCGCGGEPLREAPPPIPLPPFVVQQQPEEPRLEDIPDLPDLPHREPAESKPKNRPNPLAQALAHPTGAELEHARAARDQREQEELATMLARLPGKTDYETILLNNTVRFNREMAETEGYAGLDEVSVATFLAKLHERLEADVARLLTENRQGMGRGQMSFVQPLAPPPDPLPVFKEIYSKYAKVTAKLEQDTLAIPTRDTKRRTKFYWTPLNQVALDFEREYKIYPDLLARIIQLGLHEKWPTAAPEDAAACAKMIRRYKTERTLAMQRASAIAGLSALDQMINVAVQQATAAGTARNIALEMWARNQLTPRFR